MKHEAGSFCTSVLRTRDLDRAEAFYGALVGWTAQRADDSALHRFFQSGGRTVASLHATRDGDDVWVPHVSVDDIEQIAAEAVALGASVVDRTDVPSVSRLATLRDPEGAWFGLWQPAPHVGAELTDVVGSLWWVEVLSGDVPRARGFYERLFGWTTRETSFEPFCAYYVFERNAVQRGGLLPLDPDWEIAPRWNSIFEVADCDATIEHAKALGGSGIFVHTVPKHGRIGGICDSGGAAFIMRGPAPAADRASA